MINAIRERVTVKNGGKVEVSSPKLIDGREVEVLILLEDDADEMDETEYLLSSEANRERLLQSIKEAEEHPERLKVYKDVDELKKDIFGK